MAIFLNQHIFKKEVIPQEIIDLVPSAELSFEQSVDEGKGDPIIYPYHDYLFRAFMEHWNRRTPEDILRWYEEGVLEEKIGCHSGLIDKLFSTPHDFITDLEKWWKLYTGMAVAKRIQAPPVLAVSRRNSAYFTLNYQKIKERLLQE